VAHLAVAHEPVRQAHRVAVRGQRRVRVIPGKGAHDGRGGVCDGVAGLVGRDAPSVDDDEACLVLRSSWSVG